jgi:hypothetical protein
MISCPVCFVASYGFSLSGVPWSVNTDSTRIFALMRVAMDNHGDFEEQDSVHGKAIHFRLLSNIALVCKLSCVYTVHKSLAAVMEGERVSQT